MIQGVLHQRRLHLDRVQPGGRLGVGGHVRLLLGGERLVLRVGQEGRLETILGGGERVRDAPAQAGGHEAAREVDRRFGLLLRAGLLDLVFGTTPLVPRVVDPELEGAFRQARVPDGIGSGQRQLPEAEQLRPGEVGDERHREPEEGAERPEDPRLPEVDDEPIEDRLPVGGQLPSTTASRRGTSEWGSYQKRSSPRDLPTKTPGRL